MRANRSWRSYAETSRTRLASHWMRTILPRHVWRRLARQRLRRHDVVRRHSMMWRLAWMRRLVGLSWKGRLAGKGRLCCWRLSRHRRLTLQRRLPRHRRHTVTLLSHHSHHSIWPLNHLLLNNTLTPHLHHAWSHHSGLTHHLLPRLDHPLLHHHPHSRLLLLLLLLLHRHSLLQHLLLGDVLTRLEAANHCWSYLRSSGCC